MKYDPRRIRANVSHENMCRFCGVSRACTETMSERSSSVSRDTRSTPPSAALDVLERTPPGEQHRLVGLPNVFVTPHIGGATSETLARGAQRAVAAVADVLAGRVPPDVVNPQVLRAESRAI